MNDSEKYDRILKDCFWEYNFSADDIRRMVKEGTFEEKKFLYQKIMENSTRMIQALKLFPRDELYTLHREWKVPRHNHHYLARRKNIAGYLLFEEPLEIPELKWNP